MDSIQVGAENALEELDQLIHRVFTTDNGKELLEKWEKMYVMTSNFNMQVPNAMVLSYNTAWADFVINIKNRIELVESPEKFNIEVETEESNGMEELIDSPDLFSGDDVNG